MTATKVEKELQNAMRLMELQELVSRKPRGYFVQGMELLQAYRNGTDIEIDELHLTYTEAKTLAFKFPCPCGECAYYHYEIFPNTGEVIVHHVNGTIVAKGNFRADGGDKWE